MSTVTNMVLQVGTGEEALVEQINLITERQVQDHFMRSTVLYQEAENYLR